MAFNRPALHENFASFANPLRPLQLKAFIAEFAKKCRKERKECQLRIKHRRDEVP
jgi:hypothetical protein